MRRLQFSNDLKLSDQSCGTFPRTSSFRKHFKTSYGIVLTGLIYLFNLLNRFYFFTAFHLLDSQAAAVALRLARVVKTCFRVSRFCLNCFVLHSINLLRTG